MLTACGSLASLAFHRCSPPSQFSKPESPWKLFLLVFNILRRKETLQQASEKQKQEERKEEILKRIRRIKHSRENSPPCVEATAAGHPPLTGGDLSHSKVNLRLLYIFVNGPGDICILNSLEKKIWKL
jgi:hypothetical protein